MKKLMTLFGFFVLSFVMVCTVNAAPQLWFDLGSDGSFETMVIDGGVTPLDSNSLPGVITYNGAIGSWSVNVTTGMSSPPLEGGALDLNSTLLTSSGPASLTILFFDEYMPSSNWVANVGGTLDGTGSFVVTQDSEFHVIHSVIASLGPFGAGAFSGTANGLGGDADFFPWLVLNATITHGAGVQNSSFDFEVKPAPEPATMLLLGLGLIGLAGLRRK